MANLTDYMNEEESRRLICLNLACSERPLLDTAGETIVEKARVFEAYLKGEVGG